MLMLVSGLLIPGGVGAFIFAHRAAQRSRPATAEVMEPERHDEVIRRLRLTAYRLRNIGMALHGTAGDMARAVLPQTAKIVEAADEAFELAEDLHEYTIQSNATHAINDEQIHMASILDDALGDLNMAIRPGLREWRIAPNVSLTTVRADRRAFRFIMRDVLSVAVRGTGHGDPIAIRLDRTPGEFALLVEYAERSWVPMAGSDIEDRAALRLTLVRQLIEAHGGRVEMNSDGAERTAIKLFIPADRVMDSAVEA